MTFKIWLELFGGDAPKQDPTKVGSLAFADYHGKDGTNPKNPQGQLPPLQKRIKRK